MRSEILLTRQFMLCITILTADNRAAAYNGDIMPIDIDALYGESCLPSDTRERDCDFAAFVKLGWLTREDRDAFNRAIDQSGVLNENDY